MAGLLSDQPTRENVPTGRQKSRRKPVSRRNCGALSKVSWGKTSPGDCQRAVHLLNSSWTFSVRRLRLFVGRLWVALLSRCWASFDAFERCTIDDVNRIITSAPPKSCALDPLPTTFMKEFLPELLPYLTALCNSSLTEGYLPVSQRRAIICRGWRKLALTQLTWRIGQ